MEKLTRNYFKHIPKRCRSNHTSYSEKKLPRKTPAWMSLISKVRGLLSATLLNKDFLTRVFQGISRYFPN